MSSPSFDYGRFVWREDSQCRGRYLREAAADELFNDVISRVNQGEHDLFCGLYFNINGRYQPATPNELLTKLREAWILTRWQLPIVATEMLRVPKTESANAAPSHPTPYIVYHVGSSQKAVDDWAKMTCLLDERYKSLDDLRFAVGQDIMAEENFTPNTLIYLTLFTSMSFGILIRTSHIPFDGTGVKVTGSLLSHNLATVLGDPGHYTTQLDQVVRWGMEHENLEPCISEILQEPRDGSIFETNLNQVLNDLGSQLPRAHFLKTSIDASNGKAPLNKRIEFKFSLEDSDKIIRACKITSEHTDGASKTTVTHLAHAALAYITCVDNPPVDQSDAVIFVYGLVNARHLLIPEYRGNHKYHGSCLAASAISAPVSIFNRYDDQDRNAKQIIWEFIDHLRQEYRKQAEYPALLGIAVQMVEKFCALPWPAPQCGPQFASDGKGNATLHETYPEGAESPVLELTDFFVGLNKSDPGPFFRITEWRGRIVLSVDSNINAVQLEVVQNWLVQWRDAILLAAASQ